MKAAFDKFDSDHTGELDAEELQQAFAELNLILSLDEVRRLLSLIEMGTVLVLSM